MSLDFLEIEVRLLVAKYGREKVLQTLATVEKVNIDELFRQLDHLERVRSTPKTKGPISLEKQIEKLFIEDDKKADLLILAKEFEQKRLLPNLRDVIRFCAQNGQNIRPKSRKDTLPRVLAILAKMPASQLKEMRDGLERGSGGSFANLADAIIRGT